MTLRANIKDLAKRRPVRGVTVSDVISRYGVSRESASAALTETLTRTDRTRPGRAKRPNSIYIF